MGGGGVGGETGAAVEDGGFVGGDGFQAGDSVAAAAGGGISRAGEDDADAPAR